MAGTSTGGLKVATKQLERNPNYYAEIGSKGGSAPTKKPKGFAANPALASIAGTRGGRISRRGKSKKQIEKDAKEFTDSFIKKYTPALKSLANK